MLTNDWWDTTYSEGEIAHKMAGGIQGIKHPSRQWLVKHIPEDSTVLDVGCCNGLMLRTFKEAEKNIEYVGVDRLFEFIKWNVDNWKDQATFVKGDAEDLRQFADDSFDYVVSRHVMEHVPHYAQHIVEMFRVAKKEVIIISFLEFTGTSFDKIQYGMRKEGGSWYNRYSKEGLEQFLDYNDMRNFKIIEDYKGSNNNIIILKKEKK